MMSYEFDEIAHQDYSISLREPLGERAQLELGSLPGVSASEPQLLVACDLSRGSLKKRVGIIGLPQNNQLYTPIDYAGNKIPIPKKGIILTRKLAEILNVKAGDTLKMRPLIARRTSVTVPVMGIADTFFGLTAYVDFDYLRQLLGEDSRGSQLGTNVQLLEQIQSGVNHPTAGGRAVPGEIPSREASYRRFFQMKENADVDRLFLGSLGSGGNR